MSESVKGGMAWWWWSSGEKEREEWLKRIRDEVEEVEEEHTGERTTDYEDLEQLGYLHVVHKKEENRALVFVIGKYVRPEVHDRERLLRHVLRKLMRLSEDDEDERKTMMKIVYINTQASPFVNSPGFMWVLYTLSCVPKSLLERVECVYVLHPTLSSVAFWSGVVPMANALVLAAPVNVETVLRVEFLPKHARDIITASSGEGGVFQFVIEEEAAIIDAMNYMPSSVSVATS